jgi:HEAT repeat protein
MALLPHAQVTVTMSDGSSQGNERSLANLRPWRAGVSGNPGGRPKGIEALAREHTPAAIAALVAALSEPRERVAAAVALLDRGWGKPAQTVTDATTGEKITFLHLTAMRAFSDELAASRTIDGNAVPRETTSDNTNVSTRNLMEPATE